MKLTIPELSLVVLIGAVRLGQVDVRPQALPADRGALVRLLPRRWSSDDENDQAATNDAFEVLHFIAAKRLAAGRLTVVDATNVQPEARKPLVALAREYHCLPVAIVLDLPEKRLPRAQPRRGRTATSARTSSASSASSCGASLRGLEREGFRHVFVLHSRRRRSRRPSIERAAALEQPQRRARARSTSSATSTAASTNCVALLERARLRRSAGDGTAPIVLATRRAARRSSSATWSTAARDIARRAAAGDEHGRGRHGALRARQPRHEAAAEARGARTCRSRTAWPSRSRSSSASRRSSAQQVARLPRRPGQPLRPRRRQAGRRPRRA